MRTLEAQPEAFDGMWATHRQSVWRVLLALTRDIDLADDLLQDTYLRARKGIGSYRGGDPRAWLAAIARNVYHSHARRRHTWAEVPLDRPEADEEAPSVDLLDLLAIRQALTDLPAPFRTALVMKHYAGYSYQEIARHQHCPVGTAKWRTSEALDRLRLVLLAERSTAMAGGAELHSIPIVDYVYGVLPEHEAARVCSHLTQCTCCRQEVQELRQVVSLLDALEGHRRQMHFVELNRKGGVTLHCASMHANEQARPIETFEFQSDADARLDHLYQDGEEVPFTVAPHPEFGNLNYTATLRRPVPPGARLSLLSSGSYLPPDHRAAKPLDGGRFRLCWKQGPSSTMEFTYVQAVRLPAGAQLLSADPKPDETRGDGTVTLLWRRVLPAGRFFECTVEYRLAE